MTPAELRHLRTEWHHDPRYDHTHDPTLLFHEVRGGEELRKVEVWPDGSMGFADETQEVGGTYRSQGDIPTADEINEDPAFTAGYVSAAEFERVWRRATREGPIHDAGGQG